jgi:hypothetical protein
VVRSSPRARRHAADRDVGWLIPIARALKLVLGLLLLGASALMALRPDRGASLLLLGFGLALLLPLVAWLQARGR